MSEIWYYFSVRDNSTAGQGKRMTGLSPQWVFFKSLDNGGDLNPQPVVLEISHGIYKFKYNPDQFGDAVGQVDAIGSTLGGLILNPADRYLDIFATRESSRLLSGINSNGQVSLSPTGLDSVQVEAGINVRQAISPILAASAGVLLGAETGTVLIKGGNSAITRISATTDNAGNRTAVTLALPT